MAYGDAATVNVDIMFVAAITNLVTLHIILVTVFKSLVTLLMLKQTPAYVG